MWRGKGSDMGDGMSRARVGKARWEGGNREYIRHILALIPEVLWEVPASIPSKSLPIGNRLRNLLSVGLIVSQGNH